jgi:hypothetical protein
LSTPQPSWPHPSASVQPQGNASWKQGWHRGGVRIREKPPWSPEFDPSTLRGPPLCPSWGQSTCGLSTPALATHPQGLAICRASCLSSGGARTVQHYTPSLCYRLIYHWHSGILHLCLPSSTLPKQRLPNNQHNFRKTQTLSTEPGPRLTSLGLPRPGVQTLAIQSGQRPKVGGRR